MAKGIRRAAGTGSEAGIETTEIERRVMLYHYEVGKPYNPNRRSWPADVVQFNYMAGGLSLVGFLDNPKPREINDWQRGAANFGLYTVGDLIVLLYQFGSQPWSDTFYSIHLVPTDQRPELAPLPTDQSRHLLQIMLVNSKDGILKSMRSTTLSPEFSRSLDNAVRRQKDRQWPGTGTYEAQISRLYAQYPSTDSILSACEVRCVGGEE